MPTLSNIFRPVTGNTLIFLFGLILLLLLLLLLIIIIMKKPIFEAMIFWIMDKIHVAEHLRNSKQTFLLLCFSWLFHAKKTLYLSAVRAFI